MGSFGCCCTGFVLPEASAPASLGFIWILLGYGNSGAPRVQALNLASRAITGEIVFGLNDTGRQLCYAAGDDHVSMSWTTTDTTPATCGVQRITPNLASSTLVPLEVGSPDDHASEGMRASFSGPTGTMLVDVYDVTTQVANVDQITPAGAQSVPYATNYPVHVTQVRIYQGDDISNAEGVVSPCTQLEDDQVNPSNTRLCIGTYDEVTGVLNQQVVIGDVTTAPFLGVSIASGGQIAYSPNQTRGIILGGFNGQMNAYNPLNLADFTTWNLPEPAVDVWTGGAARVNPFDSPNPGEPPCDLVFTYSGAFYSGGTSGSVLAITNDLGTIPATVDLSDYGASAKVVRESNGVYLPNTDDAVWVEVVSTTDGYKTHLRRYEIRATGGPTNPSFFLTDDIVLNNPDTLPILDMIHCPLGPP